MKNALPVILMALTLPQWAGLTTITYNLINIESTTRNAIKVAKATKKATVKAAKVTGGAVKKVAGR